MISEVLRLLAASREGLPVTEIRRALDLPAELAASLVIQLQDAGFVSEWELEPCHHQDPGTACKECSGGSCSGSADHAQSPPAGDFGQGCCGINAPFRITGRGHAYLAAAATRS
ncbi:MAG: hypothetical protein FJZ01_21995 [Candidatus Sericytochromatia bacterium]|nr:hypothetical protein [Candidatus Tanganyikabacteria bacterium]